MVELGAVSLKCTRTDISPRYDKQSNVRVVYHIWIQYSTPRIINETGPSFQYSLLALNQYILIFLLEINKTTLSSIDIR